MAGRRKKRTKVADREALPLFASAMRQVEVKEDLKRVEGRPPHISTGLESVDRALRGGFPLGALTLVAARPKVGATSLLMGAALSALKRGERVAYFSERLKEEQLRGRFVVLESRVNGYRFRAGFVSAEDRIALAAARERIPWGELSLTAQRRVSVRELDGHIFSYRPWLVIADITPQGPRASNRVTYDGLLEGVERLAILARRHHVAMVVRLKLPRGDHRPEALELPGLGGIAEPFNAVVLLHREDVNNPDDETGSSSGLAEAIVVRQDGHEVSPRIVPLRFDQRFAGLLERS